MPGLHLDRSLAHPGSQFIQKLPGIGVGEFHYLEEPLGGIKGDAVDDDGSMGEVGEDTPLFVSRTESGRLVCGIPFDRIVFRVVLFYKLPYVHISVITTFCKDNNNSRIPCELIVFDSQSLYFCWD